MKVNFSWVFVGLAEVIKLEEAEVQVVQLSVLKLLVLKQLALQLLVVVVSLEPKVPFLFRIQLLSIQVF